MIRLTMIRHHVQTATRIQNLNLNRNLILILILILNLILILILNLNQHRHVQHIDSVNQTLIAGVVSPVQAAVLLQSAHNYYSPAGKSNRFPATPETQP